MDFRSHNQQHKHLTRNSPRLIMLILIENMGLFGGICSAVKYIFTNYTKHIYV